jgi:hypothetical protein
MRENIPTHEYKGSIRNGKRDGYGRLLISKLSSISTLQNLIKYKVYLDFKEYLESKWDKNGNLIVKKNNTFLINYTGYFKNNLPNGLGTLTFNRGTYRGQFKNGKFDGYGKLITKSSSYSFLKQSYVGYFKNNYPNGKGQFIKQKGVDRIEEGNFINGKLNGKSKITWSNSEYNGMVKDGYQNGKGNLVFHNTGDKWVGYWKKGEFVKGRIYEAKMKKWKIIK